MEGWQKVYSTSDDIRIEIIKGVLTSKDIQTISLNKKDRVYNNFGEIEIYVRPSQVIKALKIIKNEILFE